MIGSKGLDISGDARDRLERWIARFLWHWQDSGLSHADAAEIILSRVDAVVLAGSKFPSLDDPETIVKDRELRYEL